MTHCQAVSEDTNLTLTSLRHVRLIGVGTFGTVRLVEHIRTADNLALKRIRKEKGGSLSPYVQQEVAILAELDHPFVVRLVKTFETTHSFYILTELVTGGSLYDHMRGMGLLLRSQAQFYVGSLVLALEALHHRRIVYRDLKPENVLLDGRGYLKLIDFGLAKKLADVEHTFTVAGTLHYMAPEVITGHGYSYEVDVWSLGILFFELVCGRLPFGSHHAQDQDVITAILEEELNVPASYGDQAGKALMLGMMCKQPDRRLGSGKNGWEDIKRAPFFATSDTLPCSLFDQILGHDIVPPRIPHNEQYADEAELVSATLSDADELGGDAEYMLDNRWLNHETAGLAFRFRKQLDDWDLDTEPPVWGTVVHGLNHGDGWLRVGERYLPMRVNGIPVLTLRGYLLDNSKLQAPTAGLIYRCSKHLDDRDVNSSTAHPLWGTTVAGVDEGNGWLRVADRYLPTKVNGVPVLVPVL